jgi:hypothetical protein
MKCVVAALIFLATPVAADDFLSFQTPSGNISCMIATGDFAEARCDMRELTPSFTSPPADCDLDWGSSFIVGETGPGQLGCVGDTVMDDQAAVLAYGESAEAGDFVCTSQKSGITCTNGEDHGFTLSRAKQTLF